MRRSLRPWAVKDRALFGFIPLLGLDRAANLFY
jgi:hypothetical protein